MDWKQFIATVIGHLAWPGLALVLLVMCRRQVASLAERLSELSYGGAKLTFERKLLLGAEIIENAPDKPAEPLARNATRESATVDAVDQVISYYEQVNGILFAIADRAGFDVADARSVMYSLVHKGIVSKDIDKLYGTIKEARNIVVHAGVLPSKEQAIEYARQAAYLLQMLHGVDNQIGSGQVKF